MPWTRLTETARQPLTDGGRELTFAEAIHEAQNQAMAADPAVVVMGEGVDDATGIFGTCLGLEEKFGADRVFDLPIAENTCTGAALGMALTGLKPIYVHMRADFLFMGADQLVNHLAKWKYMTSGRQCAPVVIRAIIGRGWGSGAQHSQSPQGMFLQAPGLAVAMPASPYEAKGLLLAALAHNGPVLILEHRWLYNRRGAVPEEMYLSPLGRGRVVRPGRDVTICALSLMVDEALQAAEALEQEGVSAEVLDARWVSPLDEDLLLESVGRTGRLVTADTGPTAGGFGAEIAALVAEKAWERLKAPVRRVGLPASPAPAAANLEKLYYPGWEQIAQAAREVLK